MLIPVILSGGSGSRLWPVSRKAYPKPFMQLGDGETLARKTAARALRLSNGGPVLTVTSRDYYFLTRDVYEEMEPGSGDRFHFLLEPFGRNTAPAIGLAAEWARENYGPDTLLLILPADHLIQNIDRFEEAVGQAAEIARAGNLVTFGIHPTHAETGYGYIKSGSSLAAVAEGHAVAAFVEKPDEATAKQYLASGNYSWNSGMFCFSAGTMLDSLNTYAPEVAKGVSLCWDAIAKDSDPMEIPIDEFEDCPSISIDYAVMEQAENCAMVSGDFGWSDIGSWKAISELYQSDESGNRIRGKAIVVDSRNNYIQSEGRLIATVGIEDLVIVDTGDALLVARADRAQEVKEVVSQLTAQDHETATFHQTVHRPWGSYTILEDADDCKVKRLVVKPGQVLSLQLHHKRSEHWTVVQGTAKVRLGDDEFLLNANESTYIPVETLHRLENPGTEDVHLIEVQTGSYFGEDDIERFEDIYGRA